MERIENLLYSEKLNLALREVEKLGNTIDLMEKERIQIQILKSLILTEMGSFDQGLKIAEEALEESKKKDLFYAIDAIISIATTFFQLDELSECLKLIQKGERLCNKIDSELKTEKEAALKYLKGKVYRRTGEFDLAIELFENSVAVYQELGNLHEVAKHFNVMGIIYNVKGDTNQAKNLIMSSLRIFEKIGDKSAVAKSLTNLGLIHWKKGELDEALNNFYSSLTINKDLGNKLIAAAALLNIGLIYWNRGELDIAINFYENSFALFEVLNNRSRMGYCLNNIGIVNQFKGELKDALECYQKSLEIHEELGEKQRIAGCLNNIGEIHNLEGRFDLAAEYFKQSLILWEETGNKIDKCETLFNLVLVAIDRNSIGQANLYLKILQELNDNENNKYISQKYNLSEALVLKESSRVVDQARAQLLFQQVSQEVMISLENKVTADLNLCELLLREYKISENKEVLEEVNEVILKLRGIAEEQNSYIWLSKSYWLQSRMALLELDLEQAQKLLVQAKEIAGSKGLQRIADMISYEHTSLIDQIKTWQKLVEHEPPMNDIIDLTQIEQLMESMIRDKLLREEEEVLEYASKAKALVKRLEEEL